MVVLFLLLVTITATTITIMILVVEAIKMLKNLSSSNRRVVMQEEKENLLV